MINIDMNIDPNLQGILDGGFDKRIQMLPIDCFVYNDLNGDFDSIDDILLFAEEIYEQEDLKIQSMLIEDLKITNMLF